MWLVGFGDASEDAYAACVHIRCMNEEGSVTATLAAAKTRVAKVKKETTPRLELRAATLSRLMTKAREALERVVPLQRVVCATDAEIVYINIPIHSETA